MCTREEAAEDFLRPGAIWATNRKSVGAEQ